MPNRLYRTDVDLTWVVTEPDSAVTVTGCVNQHVSADQPATTYSCSATSEGGAAGPVTAEIARDGTPPTLATVLQPTSPDGANGWYVTQPTVTSSCDDNLSGVAVCPTDMEVPEGQNPEAWLQARDIAGNTALTACHHYRST